MSAILDLATDYLRNEVGPNANEMDSDPQALAIGLRGLCERDLMALRRPTEFGGPGLSETDFRQFQETVARYSGALAFLQTQHQSAGSMISRSDNELLKLDYLPKMASGEKLLGIGFSQLRRSGTPLITATKAEGGYELNGHVPWLTGFGFFQEFVIGATLEDGSSLFGIVPFAAMPERLSFSEPMKLCSMEAAQTVTGDLKAWYMRDQNVLFIKPGDWITNNDMINVTLQGHFAIGCARAGIDIIEAVANKKNLTFIHESANRLLAEWTDCRTQTIAAQGLTDAAEKLRVRAWAIDLAVRCAHAAIVASSGASNSLTHPAQRVYREALVFSVSAQTTPIMEETLNRLSRKGSHEAVLA